MACDAEVYACVKLIRGSRSGRDASRPVTSWSFGNMRVTDATEFMPSLDFGPVVGRSQPVKLDVVVGGGAALPGGTDGGGGIVVEQWRISPGQTAASATCLSIFVRSLYQYLRCFELGVELANRTDVSLRLTQHSGLIGNDARLVWTVGQGGTSVQACMNPFWRRELQALDAVAGYHYNAAPTDTLVRDSSTSIDRLTSTSAPQLSPSVGNSSQSLHRSSGSLQHNTHTTTTKNSQQQQYTPTQQRNHTHTHHRRASSI